MKAAPCTRPLPEQAQDKTGSRRRGDHELRRLDLLSDVELDAYQSRFGSEALDASHVLAEALEISVTQIEEAARQALEHRSESRPVLTVVVCMSCGAFEVARVGRAWAIDRAMRRSGLSEREIREVLALLTEAGADHSLDQLTAEKLRELRCLVGRDVDLDSVRDRYAS